jgi:hypothetical protein
MVTRETIAVGVSGGVGTVLMVGLELTVGFGEWLGLASFVYLGLFWYALPQLYLSVADDGLSVLRIRLIPVILFLLAVAVSISPLASGRELLAIWAIVAVAVGLLFASAFRSGYRDAMESGGEE